MHHPAHLRHVTAVVLALSACGDDGASPLTATVTASSSPTAAGTTEPGEAGSESTDATATEPAPTSTDATTDVSTDATTTAPLDVPTGVFLWTGAGGGGPATDLYVDAVVDVLTGAGVPVAQGTELPDGFAQLYGTLVYMNPQTVFPAEVDAAASALVNGGGRLVLVMEHCKNGCWSNADGHNTLLAALGAGMRLAGDGGAELESTVLDVTPTPPLTDGVGSLVAYYSGHVVMGPDSVAVGRISGGDVVVALETIGAGEVLAVADSSMLGYVLGEADNSRFVENFALH